jgi:endonuclease YncB( thermonuclease family)
MGCSNSKDDSHFLDHKFNNTDYFNFCDQKMIARVVDIHDGDTCVCILNIYDYYYKFKIRLADIDTCEINSKNEKNRLLAIKARNKLFNLVTHLDIDMGTKQNKIKDILNEKVYTINLECGNYDKYGRILGWLYDTNNSSYNKEESFNYQLLRCDLAYKYGGNKKLSEEEQQLSLQ